MNMRMIGILVRKDLHLLRLPVLFYLAAGALSVGLMGVERHIAFYAGSVLLITALIALGFHPSMATVVGERKEQTLAFVMSMPLTPADYLWSKLLTNAVLFFIPWALLTAATVGLIVARPTLPDGLIPYALILFGAIATGAVLILCVALATESMQWTIVAQVGCNLAFQGVMYGASNVAAIRSTLNGELVVWSGPVLLFLGLEAACAALLLALTLWHQSRKTDFI
jgi:hypothetical protein